jgi:hypothetical protein
MKYYEEKRSYLFTYNSNSVDYIKKQLEAQLGFYSSMMKPIKNLLNNEEEIINLLNVIGEAQDYKDRFGKLGPYQTKIIVAAESVKYE